MRDEKFRPYIVYKNFTPDYDQNSKAQKFLQFPIILS